MDDDDRSAGDGPDPLAPGVEQFQKAALDTVRAMRSMLDAAEAMIADPSAIESMVHTVTSMARVAGETVVGFATGATGAKPPGGKGRDDDGDGPEPGYQRIRVD